MPGYESPTAGLDKKEIEKAQKVGVATPEKPAVGRCIHVPARPTHKRISVRGSRRVMELCEGCYGVMERAGCIHEVLP